MKGSDNIVSMIYIKIYILMSSTYEFLLENCFDDVKNIKERVNDLDNFKNDISKNQVIYKYIQAGIQLWKDEMKIAI